MELNLIELRCCSWCGVCLVSSIGPAQRIRPGTERLSDHVGPSEATAADGQPADFQGADFHPQHGGSLLHRVLTLPRFELTCMLLDGFDRHRLHSSVQVVRKVGPSVFGLSAINLYLLYTTVLFVAREGVRRAAMRYAEAAPQQPAAAAHPRSRHHAIINLCWLTVPFGAVLALTLRFLSALTGFAAPQPSQLLEAGVPTGDYQLAVDLFLLSSVVELLSEPLYVLGYVQLQVARRVALETAAVRSTLASHLIRSHPSLSLTFISPLTS